MLSEINNSYSQFKKLNEGVIPTLLELGIKEANQIMHLFTYPCLTTKEYQPNIVFIHDKEYIDLGACYGFEALKRYFKVEVRIILQDSIIRFSKL